MKILVTNDFDDAGSLLDQVVNYETSVAPDSVNRFLYMRSVISLVFIIGHNNGHKLL